MLLSHKFRFGVIALLLAAAFVLIPGCQDDDETKTGTLTGTVIFHGDWPDSGTVQLSIFENWDIAEGNCSWCVNAAGGPPAYYTDASFFQDPDPNNTSDADTLTFEISGITLGTYNSIVTGWRAPTPGAIACDEPIVGMYGANPMTDDSLPTSVVFSESSLEQSITVDTYFDYFLPVPGCEDRGRIEGTMHLNGTYPAEGMLVMLTAFPVAGFGPNAWFQLAGQPTDYYVMESSADTFFRFTPPFGTYYLSVWNNAGQFSSTWHGAYGIDTQLRPTHPAVTDARPDAIVLDSVNSAARDLEIRADIPAPHWISGHVTYTGSRPAEGLLVMVTTFPVSPTQPPTGQPLGYFIITDDSETLYSFTGVAEGTYYLSLWNNVQGPGSTCYGAYGWATGDDPDPVVIDGTTNFGRTGINISN